VTLQDKRSNRRISLDSPAYALMGDTIVDLHTHNVSLGGSLVSLPQHKVPTVGARLDVWLEELGFGAEARVRWTADAADGKALMGLQFEHLDFSLTTAATAALG
jgi:hypothetical protein